MNQGRPHIAAEHKLNLISRDFELLLDLSRSHQNAKLVAEVVQTTSWCRLWDIALDRGVKGTRGLQNTPERIEPAHIQQLCLQSVQCRSRQKISLV